MDKVCSMLLGGVGETPDMFKVNLEGRFGKMDEKQLFERRCFFAFE